MRTSSKLIAALSVAGLAFAGGSAFTASNTLPEGSVSGYGQSVSSGATITDISNTLVTGDTSRLASVTFTSSTDVTGKAASMTLKSGDTVVGTSYACDLGDFVTDSMTITCATGDNPLMNAFDTTGLTII